MEHDKTRAEAKLVEAKLAIDLALDAIHKPDGIPAVACYADVAARCAIDAKIAASSIVHEQIAESVQAGVRP